MRQDNTLQVTTVEVDRPHIFYIESWQCMAHTLWVRIKVSISLLIEIFHTYFLSGTQKTDVVRWWVWEPMEGYWPAQNAHMRNVRT